MLENFININIIAGIFVTIGLTLFFFDLLLPKLGFISILSLFIYTLGFIIALYAETTILEVIISSFTALLFILIIGFLGLYSKKIGILSRLSIINKTKAKNTEILKLVGKKGIISIDCNPMGKINIDSKYYNAVAAEGALDKNIKAEVVDIKDSLLIVKEDKSTNNKKVEIEWI